MCFGREVCFLWTKQPQCKDMNSVNSLSRNWDWNNKYFIKYINGGISWKSIRQLKRQLSKSSFPPTSFHGISPACRPLHSVSSAQTSFSWDILRPPLFSLISPARPSISWDILLPPYFHGISSPHPFSLDILRQPTPFHGISSAHPIQGISSFH